MVYTKASIKRHFKVDTQTKKDTILCVHAAHQDLIGGVAFFHDVFQPCHTGGQCKVKTGVWFEIDGLKVGRVVNTGHH